MRGKNHAVREFEKFRIDLLKKVLWFQDEPVHLPAKAVEVLCVLVENRGQIVTKEELLDQVWPDSFVEESVLSQNIHHLRKTFKDLNFQDNSIQTIPRRGYRFAADIHEIDDVIIEHEVLERSLLAEISEDSLKDLDLRNAAPVSPVRSQHGRNRRFSAGVIVAVGLLTIFVFWSYNRPAEQSALERVRSLAVLPLRNLNAQEQHQAFSLGLTDSLISRLGGLNRFAVRPFSAVDKYEKSGKDAIAFGRDLRVDSVLEGTVQTVDNRLRVNLRLIEVQNGQQIWADSFDETVADPLKLQDSISGKVARFLLTKLRPEEEILLAKRPTANAEAFRLYLTGRESWLRRGMTPDCLIFYRKAIELDPNFALAYLGIADQFAFTYETEVAEEALRKAMEIDPNLADAHATQGFLRMFHHWDWTGAENSFRRAIELAPNSSKAHHWYGVYLSLRGRLDEAMVEMEKALELDPTASIIKTDIAELYYFKRDYERAETELQNVLAFDPSFIKAREHLIKVRYKRGASYFLEDAEFSIYRQRWRKAEGLGQEFDTTELEQVLVNGDEKTVRDRTLKVMREAVKSSPANRLPLSLYYLVVGEKEKALQEINEACEAKVFLTPFVAVDPMWDPVRDEVRFQEVLKKMNLKS